MSKGKCIFCGCSFGFHAYPDANCPGKDLEYRETKYCDNKKEILESAINHYGVESQVDMAIEEMAELTQALLKYRRVDNHLKAENVLEEIADVKIMLKQLEIIFAPIGKAYNFESIAEVELKKLARLQGSLE